jgi:hypothetical protein
MILLTRYTSNRATRSGRMAPRRTAMRRPERSEPREIWANAPKEEGHTKKTMRARILEEGASSEGTRRHTNDGISILSTRNFPWLGRFVSSFERSFLGTAGDCFARNVITFACLLRCIYARKLFCRNQALPQVITLCYNMTYEDLRKPYESFRISGP